MALLIALVIAMFLIVAVYVGYHASQQMGEEGEAHNINIELENLNENSGLVQILENTELRKTIL